MRGSGRTIRIRKAPSFSGRSIYLDGVSDYIDFQGVAKHYLTFDNNQPGYYWGRQNNAGSFPVELMDNGCAWWGRFSSLKNDTQNKIAASGTPYINGIPEQPFFRPRSFQIWVKFPEEELKDVTDRYNNNEDMTKRILHICGSKRYNMSNTSPHGGFHIALQGNTSGSVNIIMGHGRMGAATVAKRVLRRGHSMLAPDTWYHIVCVWDGWKAVGNPGYSMYVNGKTRANVTLKFKDHSSSDTYVIARIQDSAGLVKYYLITSAGIYSNMSNGTVTSYSPVSAAGYGIGSTSTEDCITVQCNGKDAANCAERLKLVIESASGHNGSIICTTDGTGYITLQSKTPGAAGNTSIKIANTTSVGTYNLNAMFEQNGQLQAVAGQGNKLLSASFSNGTDNQVNAQTLTPSYPKGTVDGELAYHTTTDSKTYAAHVRVSMTSFIGKDNSWPSINTAMTVNEAAMWENAALDAEDVTGLYNEGSPLADLTQNANGYTKSQPTTASVVIPMHNITKADAFRLQDTTGKYKWFTFRDEVAENVAKPELEEADEPSGWADEINGFTGVYRIVFGAGAIYSPTPTITLTSVSSSTEITYEGTNTTTANGTLLGSGHTSFISNVVDRGTKAGNLAAAITSSNGHGLSRFSCSIKTTLHSKDTLIIHNVKTQQSPDFSGFNVDLDQNTPNGFTRLTASQANADNNGLNLSGSFTNGGNYNRLTIPMHGVSSEPEETDGTFNQYKRRPSEYLTLAKYVTASILHKNAFRNTMSCSIVYANATNQYVPSGSDTKPAVRVYQLTAGGKGNTPVVYGYGTSTGQEGNINVSGIPVVGLSPKLHRDIWSTAGTGSLTKYFYDRNNQQNIGVNKRWMHLGARSESFCGGGLRLQGHWKMQGPAIDPTEPQINVLGNVVQSSSMMEHPFSARWVTSHGQGSPIGDPVYSHREIFYQRTNPALNVGGTWSGESPS